MPVPTLRGNSRGAQIVTIIVDTPTRLTKAQQDLLIDFTKLNKDKDKHGFWH
jgi:DnaJ-class molecular chaperone